ncbi:MAG TPA: lipase maturation factor family protein, partial [bacterium]|nr:lipase maturation factor family protein [bacterium]
AYLSLVTVGGDFLGFQWDNLLLECDLLALFLVPLGISVPRGARVPGLAAFACRWLLFRLMLGSGLVKLESGDPAWRHLTALFYHYQTQPLPTPLAWWMAQLPGAFQRASCFFVLAVELGAPLLLIGPRRFRAYAFPPLALLQVLIALTGNYCFFNLLALGLCFFALEDAAWPARARAWFAPRAGRGVFPPVWARALLLAPLLLISAAQFAGLLGLRWPGRVLAPLEEAAAPFRSVNPYGLFAVMTTRRFEITVEGSDDGAHWKAYGFQDKPGDLSRAPRWVAPLQPRLDWQMWFAALGPAEESPWLKAFLTRLLQGSPQVTALLGDDPFPDAPPRSIRAEIAEYRFTDAAERARTGDWWERGEPQLYVPAFSLAGVK